MKSDFPVVAYQFNPLDNVAVFSNDASLLRPTEALVGANGNIVASYVVLGWPQTIASSDDPNTNFNPNDPTDLRAFLTIVGTHDKTRVRVETAARIIGGGPVPETQVGDTLEITIGAYDVLNLETGNFNADFTGSVVSADHPVVVFSGGEASDAPSFTTLSERRCCADHLEEQLDPIRTAGKQFVASISANRSEMVAAAGANIGAVQQPEYFRVIAVTDKGATITTTLDGADASFVLPKRGSWASLSSTRPFLLDSSEPVQFMSVSASQDDSGIPRGLPGGDPSMLIVPPIEQFRDSYVFLTPDNYNFDLVRVIATPDTNVVMDGTPIDQINGCIPVAGDGLTPDQRGPAAPALDRLSLPARIPDHRSLRRGSDRSTPASSTTACTAWTPIAQWASWWTASTRTSPTPTRPAPIWSRSSPSNERRRLLPRREQRPRSRAAARGLAGPLWRMARSHSLTDRRRGPKIVGSAASASISAVGWSTP